MSSLADDMEGSHSAIPASSSVQNTPTIQQVQSGADLDDNASYKEGSVDPSGDEELEQQFLFSGPLSTWLKYTADERSLIASFDRQQAKDLSIHLYNTHMYTANLYDLDRPFSIRPSESKVNWLRREEQGNLPWIPPQLWTAWPLSAEDVPRPGEDYTNGHQASGVDEDTLKRAENWRPSQDLADEIQALMLRKAKERFRRRQWRELRSPSMMQPANSISTIDADDRAIDPLGFQANDTDLDPDRSSRSPAAIEDDPSESVSLDVTADDAKASQILGPSVRHTLTQLDELLSALHTSRAGQRIATDHSSDRPMSASRKRKRSVSGANRTKSASSKVRREVEESTEEQAESSVWSDESTRSLPSKRFHTRDWSEVVGLAAIIGWDASVVDRTIRRCTSLFGEAMAMRTMSELRKSEAQDHVTIYSPDMESGTAAPKDGHDKKQRTAKTKATFCPFETCARSQEAYSGRNRFREHMRRVHSWTVQDTKTYEAERFFRGEWYLPD